MAITKMPFGTLPNGTTVSKYTLIGSGGLSVSIIDFGATIQSIIIDGKDVTLGYPMIDGYLTNGGYLGATVGRYANRIAGGTFTLNGKMHTLAKNDGNNHLHGGTVGYSHRMWDMTVTDGDIPTVKATLFSPDGEEGFTGNVTVTVTFSVTADNTLHIVYDADTDADTVLNLTNHTYFNLNGGGNVADTILTLHADAYTPIDDNLIPYEIAMVDGTPFDYRTPHTIGDALASDHPQIVLCRGIDHNFILNGEDGTLRPAAKAYHPASGITLTCATDLPAMQVYTANFLDNDGGKNGKMRMHEGFCLETQFYPNSPNTPAFPSCVLRAGEHFHRETAFGFYTK